MPSFLSSFRGSKCRGEDRDGDGNQDIWAAGDFQKNVTANFNTPLSIGLGTTFKIEDVHIYLSVQWFSPLEKFDANYLKRTKSPPVINASIHQIYAYREYK
jgi:hypothetical protein